MEADRDIWPVWLLFLSLGRGWPARGTSERRLHEDYSLTHWAGHGSRAVWLRRWILKGGWEGHSSGTGMAGLTMGGAGTLCQQGQLTSLQRAPDTPHLQAWLGGRFPQELQKSWVTGGVLGSPELEAAGGPACARESGPPLKAAASVNLEPL